MRFVRIMHGVACIVTAAK